MENNTNILIANGFIDFYVNKEKFESYKTEKGKINFIRKSLDEILEKISKLKYPNLLLKEVSYTSNGFYGDLPTEINDLNYSASNQKPLNDQYKTFRFFNINLYGHVPLDASLFDYFISIKGEDYYLVISSTNII